MHRPGKTLRNLLDSSYWKSTTHVELPLKPVAKCGGAGFQACVPSVLDCIYLEAGVALEDLRGEVGHCRRPLTRSQGFQRGPSTKCVLHSIFCLMNVYTRVDHG